MKEKIRTLPIRIPHEMWVRLRRLQEQGKIRSINQAVNAGLKWLIKKEG